ncbi:MAG: hypothetical protein R2940_09030 [Syntrophotaleaceae bacterium]
MVIPARKTVKNWVELWETGRILKSSFDEQKICIRDVYQLLDQILQTPEYTPVEYRVSLADIPNHFFSVRKNVFSTLFHASYLLLDIPLQRRLLYGKLNHLFRIWVTSADNLLDKEDKVVVPLEMAGQSTIMRQVIAIMAADRVMKHLLDDAVAAGTIDSVQSRLLSDRSLQVLLPSAAQEASEEGGIVERPDPEYVLSTIHVLKTGILFNIPFLGPDLIEDQLDQDRVAGLKKALLDFGLGCQLLDDLRDLAKDYLEKRHNYVLSILAREKNPVLIQWQERLLQPNDRLYHEVPQAACPTLRLALQLLRGSLKSLEDLGLGIRKLSKNDMAASMLTLLDLEDLQYAC